MKPLLVSFSDLGGGAARAAFRLHGALRSEGIDSNMLVRRKLSDVQSVHAVPFIGPTWAQSLRSRAETYFQRLQQTPNPVLHSSNLTPTRLSRRLQGEVVDLHWIGSGTMSIEDIGRIEAPIVMTLHDMWGFCGSEHYAPDKLDARWVTGYTRENRYEHHHGLDLDRWTWNRKRKHWGPITIIAPSRWIAACVGRSALMASWPVHVVPYAIDLDVFHPHDSVAARHALGLPSQANVVLFGAMGGARDPRKGFDLLMGALKIFADSTGGSETIGVIFGQDEPDEPPEIGLPLYWVGHIDDSRDLASVYSAADVMIVPSRQDNLPQTGIEAQACGTPVVAFRTSGMPDVVAHKETGYLVSPFSTQELAHAIDWVLDDARRRDVLGREARERAKRLWDPRVVASRYREVYQEAIRRHLRDARERA